MAIYTKELEQILELDKRKKHAVLITTNTGSLAKVKGKQIIEGTYAASINYRQLLSLKNDNAINGIELDEEMTVQGGV